MTKSEIERVARDVAAEEWITVTSVECDEVLGTLRIEIDMGYTEEQATALALEVSRRITFALVVLVERIGFVQ